MEYYYFEFPGALDFLFWEGWRGRGGGACLDRALPGPRAHTGQGGRAQRQRDLDGQRDAQAWICWAPRLPACWPTGPLFLTL